MPGALPVAPQACCCLCCAACDSCATCFAACRAATAMQSSCGASLSYTFGCCWLCCAACGSCSGARCAAGGCVCYNGDKASRPAWPARCIAAVCFATETWPLLMCLCLAIVVSDCVPTKTRQLNRLGPLSRVRAARKLPGVQEPGGYKCDRAAAQRCARGVAMHSGRLRATVQATGASTAGTAYC